MQVNQLVQDTLWIPGSSYSNDTAPAISVLLPTFRRGESGLFRRCVESILSQTLKDIELIIIDDASTDGTAGQIEEFQRHDGRVSCLRHQNNVGLPAISEYEGYMRARGSRIAFAFDDTIFKPDALERLLEEAYRTPWAVVYGHIEWPYFDQVQGEVVTGRLGSAISQGALRSINFIPNSAVLMPREILEDVGLYDPHILIARVCDWDLWRRVAARYELRFVDVPVGLEDGMVSSDSLGNTYMLDTWAAEEWKQTDRNLQLRPDRFASNDVLAPDETHGLSTQMVCLEAAKKHAEQRGWRAEAFHISQQVQDGYTLVVAVGHDASVSLCFDFLPPELTKRIRVVVFSTAALEDLARATCVVFIRAIEPYRAWIDAAVFLGIPIYYLLDDNLPLLAMHGEYSALGEDLSLAGLRKNLGVFEGVWLTSKNLLSYFEANHLHKNLTYYPVGCADQSPVFVDHRFPKEPGEVTVAFAGGVHRLTTLWEVIVPALTMLALEVPKLHLVFRETDAAEHLAKLAALPVNIRVTMLSYEPDYMFALRRFARYSPDILLHAPSDTRNNPYKTLHPLLSAQLINAVAVIPLTAPYDQISQSGCAAFVENPFEPSAWFEALREIVSSRTIQESIKDSNTRFCEAHFSCAAHIEIFGEVYRQHRGEPSWLEQSARLYKLCGFVLRFGIKTGAKDARMAETIAAEKAVLEASTVADEKIRNAEKEVRKAESAVLAIEKREAAAKVFFESKLSALANVISELRNREYRSGKHRWSSRSKDQFQLLSPAFDPLKVFSERIGWRTKSSSLGLSESLINIPYREYVVDSLPEPIYGVLVAFSADWVCGGTIGIELIDTNNEILEQVYHQLEEVSLSEPVNFVLPKPVPPNAGRIHLRIFARAENPLYIYEFSNIRMAGLLPSSPTPFLKLTHNGAE